MAERTGIGQSEIENAIRPQHPVYLLEQRQGIEIEVLEHFAHDHDIELLVFKWKQVVLQPNAAQINAVAREALNLLGLDNEFRREIGRAHV